MSSLRAKLLSVNWAVTPVSASATKVSKRSSRAGLRDDGSASFVASERAGDAARVGELKKLKSLCSISARLWKRRSFVYSRKSFALTPKPTVFKTTSKERVHAAMTTPSLPELKPLKLETELQDQGSTCHQSPRENNYSGRGPPPRPGRVRGFCSLRPVWLPSVYSQRGSEKGSDWFTAVTDCPSASCGIE